MAGAHRIRIVLADDHHIVLDGIAALLRAQPDLEIVATYQNGLQLLAEIAVTNPDIALVDISMVHIGGVDLAERIRKIRPATRVIALSMHDDMTHIRKMLDAGVWGYVLKSANDRQLLEAIHSVSSGIRFFSPEVTEKIARSGAAPEGNGMTSGGSLTAREIEILKLFVQEYTNQEIAAKLYISERTVETHRKNMMRKTNNKTIVGLIKYAIDNGLSL